MANRHELKEVDSNELLFLDHIYLEAFHHIVIFVSTQSNEFTMTIKKILFIFLLPIILSGCKSYIQIFDTATTNTEVIDNFFVFETDSIKITYSFWAANGVMTFAVYNKLEKPIYIDWKNSSFIYNDNKLNYWIDEIQTNMASYYGGYYYNGPLLRPGVTSNEGIQTMASASFKPERVTFIPPKSNYYRSQFYLLPGNYYSMDFNCQKIKLPRNDNPKKTTIVYNEDFTMTNSPLRFRNYLAFSFIENATQFFFVDNGFYLSSAKEMDFRHHRGQYIVQEGAETYQKPYKKPTSFYINIPAERSIEYRKKYGTNRSW